VKMESQGRRTISTAICGGLTAVAILLFCAAGSWAGIYKFVDSKGVMHYTDNLLQVPEDQRPALEEEPMEPVQPKKSGAGVVQVSAKQKGVEKKTVTSAKSVAAANTRTSENELQQNRLESRRKKLDGEYAAIMLEQKRLSQMRETVKTAEERKKFVEAAERLNARIKAYEKNRDALAVLIQQYNEKVRQFEEKRKALEAEMASFTGNANGG